MNQGAGEPQETYRAFVVRLGDGRWRFMRSVPRQASAQDIQVVTITGPVGFDPRWPAVPIARHELDLYREQFTLSPYEYIQESYQADRHGTVAGKIDPRRQTVEQQVATALSVPWKIIGAVFVLGVVVAVGVIVWLFR